MMGSGVAAELRRASGRQRLPTGLGTEVSRSGAGAVGPPIRWSALERERTSVDAARRPSDLANTPSGSLIEVPGVSRTVVGKRLIHGVWVNVIRRLL